ncbi:MAG: hypothetical protein K2G85_07430 [Muribaculaceae bacterium]|nr:hypothetical protein [Muribaculaceae bacterium]
MKKLLLTMAVAGLCSSAFAAESDVTTVLDQTFGAGTTLENTDAYTWGAEIQGMITSTGLYMTNGNDSKDVKNYENRDFVSFTNAIGSATQEVSISYQVYSPKDKSQTNTNYEINYFNAEGKFIFGIQETSGGWAYGANIITATEDGSTNTTNLSKGHLSKGGGSEVNLTVKFAGNSAFVTVDGGTYTAYTASEGIKDIKLSVTGGYGWERDMSVKNFVVKTTEVAAAQFADYTVQYVCDGEILKEETKSGEVGSEISLLPTETADFTLDGVKYIYVENNAKGKTVDAESATVVTITFRKAAEYNYIVKNNVNDVTVTGSCLEGNSEEVPYKRYILTEEGALWEKYPGKNTPYTITFTPDADNYEVELDYTETEITDAVFYVEAEDLPGVKIVTGSNANVRCSNAAGAYADEATEVCKLAPGTYKVTIAVMGNAGATIVVKAGEETVVSAETAGYWLDAVSEEFTLLEETSITFEGANSSKPLDYVLITGTVDPTSAVEAVEAAQADGKWYNLQGVQVAQPAVKGLYIHNGKKVIVK